MDNWLEKQEKKGVCRDCAGLDQTGDPDEHGQFPCRILSEKHGKRYVRPPNFPMCEFVEED